MTRTRLTFLFCLLATGCERGATTDQRTEAASVTAQAACSLPPDAATVCNGPWQYKVYAPNCAPSSYTDQTHCNQPGECTSTLHYQTCQHVLSTATKHFTPGIPGTTQRVCTRSLPQPCTIDGCPGPKCIAWGTQFIPSKLCPDIANVQLNKERAAAQAQRNNGIPMVPAGAFDTSTIQLANFSNPTVQICAFDIINVPTLNTVTDLTCGPQLGAITCACTRPNPHSCGDTDGIAGTHLNYSAPGMTQAAVKQANDVDGTPVCMTCDDLPLGDRTATNAASLAQAKADCLLAHAHPTAFVDSDKALEIAQTVTLKLLLETRGDLLTAPERASIEALYVSQPDVAHTPACATQAWNPLASTASCALDPVNADLSVCIRLVGDHVPGQVRALYQDRCMGSLPPEIAALPAACPSQVAQTYEGLSVQLMQKDLADQPIDVADDTQLDASRATVAVDLGAIDRWFRNQRAIYKGTPADLFTDLDRVLAAFWKVVHNDGVGSLGSGGAAVTAASLKNASKVGLAADRLVLLAAFTPDDTTHLTPLTSAPLLYIVGDAFEEVWEKLDAAVVFHDLGCRYARCAQTQRTDELTDMWSFLAALPNAKTLGDRVDDITNNKSHLGTDWAAVLTAIQKQHATLEAAVLDDYPAAALTAVRPTGDYGSELLQRSAVLPAGAVRLAGITAAAQVRMTNFASTGTLSGFVGETLRSGIAKSHIADVQSDFANRSGALSAAVTKYDQDRATLVGALVQQVANAGNQQALSDRAQEQAQLFEAAESQIEALRNHSQIDDARFGDFVAAWKTRTTTVDLNSSFQTKTYQSFRVTPASARYTSGVLTAPDVAVVVNPTMTDVPVGPGNVAAIPVGKGEVLHIDTGTGTWAPTCAINNYAWPSPPFTGGIHIDPTSMVGPEGYMLQHSVSGYSATAQTGTNSNDTYSNVDGDFSTCLNATFGTKWDFIAIASVTVSSSACVQAQFGERESKNQSSSDSTGGDDRQSAVFASGLRAPNTPFPDYPAGSLLLVEVAAGDPNNTAARIQVLRSGNSGFVADRDATVYLVVNDLSCPDASAGNKGGFDVTVSRLTPMSAIAGALGDAMADQLASLRAQLPTYVAQRAFWPSEKAALEKASLDALIRPPVTQVSQIPPDLMSLYTTRVELELAGIERAVEAETLLERQREIDLTMRELGNELTNAKDQSRLLELVPMWELRNLDGDQLRAKVTFLAALMNEDLYPIIRIRYPELLDGTNVSGLFPNGVLISQLQKLIDVDWRGELFDQAALVSDAATAVQNIFSNEVLHGAAIHATPVIVSVPRPGMNPAWLSGFPQVDPERALAIWNQLDTSGTAAITIKPEDVYRLHGGPSVLVCGSESAPVVQAMQVFFNVGDNPAGDDWTLKNYTAPMQVASDLTFETDLGPERYSVLGGDWLKDPAHLLFGLAPEVSAKVNAFLQNPTIHAGTGEGLSPFTTFTLDLQYYLNPGSLDPRISDLQEMLLVFETEYRDGAGVQGVASCR
jgi:hypothetical protein